MVDEVNLVWGVCGIFSNEEANNPAVPLLNNREYVALVDSNEYKSANQVKALRAWKVNTQTGKFEKISAKNITCLHESPSDYSG